MVNSTDTSFSNWCEVVIGVPECCHVFERALFNRSASDWRLYGIDDTFKRRSKVGAISELFQRGNNKNAGNHCCALISFLITTPPTKFHHDL